MVSLAHTIVEFIVNNGAPMAGLLILHWLHIYEVAKQVKMRTGESQTYRFPNT